MLRKYFSLFLVVFSCLVIFACSDDSGSGHSLSDVETWTFSGQIGYMDDPQSQFDQYDDKFITESQWNNIRQYSHEDGSFQNETWFGFRDWLLDRNFGNGGVTDFKAKLASDERATFFYKNTSGYYRWIRILKN